MSWFNFFSKKNDEQNETLLEQKKYLLEKIERYKILDQIKDDYLIQERERNNNLLVEAMTLFSALALSNEDGKFLIEKTFIEAAINNKKYVLNMEDTEEGTMLKLNPIKEQREEE